jgi:hypothetical protein
MHLLLRVFKKTYFVLGFMKYFSIFCSILTILGSSLAEKEFFLFFGALVHTFKFTNAPGQKENDIFNLRCCSLNILLREVLSLSPVRKTQIVINSKFVFI